MNILYVENDTKFQELVVELMELESYNVFPVQTAFEAFSVFKKQHFDLILMDLGLDDINGLELVYLMKKINNDIKIIILTGSEQEEDELRGLDLGVVDYLKKPIRLSVLIKRINIALKKQVSNTTIVSNAEKIRIDLQTRTVYKDNQPFDLTALEHDLLVFFLMNRNVTLSREEIYKNVWRSEFVVGDLRTVDTYVKKLRYKLGLNNIFAIRGVGYEWFEAV